MVLIAILALSTFWVGLQHHFLFDHDGSPYHTYATNTWYRLAEREAGDLSNCCYMDAALHWSPVCHRDSTRKNPLQMHFGLLICRCTGLTIVVYDFVVTSLNRQIRNAPITILDCTGTFGGRP